MKAPEALLIKLNPRRFSGMSGKMAAILGFILEVKLTDPEIAEIGVTSDGFLFARTKGEIGMNYMIGSYLDLEDNLLRLFDVAGLTADEQYFMSRQLRSKIRDWRIH